MMPLSFSVNLKVISHTANFLNALLLLFITQRMQHMKYIQLQWVKIEIKVSHTSRKNEHSILECPEQVTTNKPTNQT